MPEPATDFQSLTTEYQELIRLAQDRHQITITPLQKLVGATLLSAAESLLFSTGGAWWSADRVEVAQNRELIQTALSEEEFNKAWKQGTEMAIDQAIDFASNDFP